MLDFSLLNVALSDFTVTGFQSDIQTRQAIAKGINRGEQPQFILGTPSPFALEAWTGGVAFCYSQAIMKGDAGSLTATTNQPCRTKRHENSIAQNYCII